MVMDIDKVGGGLGEVSDEVDRVHQTRDLKMKKYENDRSPQWL